MKINHKKPTIMLVIFYAQAVLIKDSFSNPHLDWVCMTLSIIVVEEDKTFIVDKDVKIFKVVKCLLL